MMKSLLLGVLTFHLVFAQNMIERTQVHMGTFTTLSLPESKQNLFKKSFQLVSDVDNTFSTYKKTSEVSQLNQNQLISKASVYLLELLALSKKTYKLTSGYFSIAIGSITKQYHFGKTSVHIPSAKHLSRVESLNLGFIIEGETVNLDDSVSLDFGGIAKGYAVDKVKAFLIKEEVNHFRIALSGDIYCHGECEVAIQSPFDKSTLFKVLHLKNSAISTSGNYERYVKSKKYNHLINPKTKQSQHEIASLTLYSKHYSNAFLDALATGLSVMPHKKRLQLLAEYKDIHYIFITNDKKVYQSDKK